LQHWLLVLAPDLEAGQRRCCCKLQTWIEIPAKQQLERE
jgi:hypothetical protein